VVKSIETPTVTALLTPEFVSTLADIYAFVLRQPQPARTVAVETGALIAEAQLASQLQ
jgi:hypothetical protein